MGQVDLDFTPSVPVFDANVALGRRRDRTVSVDTVEGTLEAMNRAGIDRALVYSTRTLRDAREGNQVLLEEIRNAPRLVPQFVCNPAADELDDFAAEVSERQVRSIRMFPTRHSYPFRDWAVEAWLEWLASEGLPVWIGADEFDPAALHDTLKHFPSVTVVLYEVHYIHMPWARLLLKSLPNLCVELSRVVGSDGIATLLETVGVEKVLFGSRFPDSPMAPQLYNLHLSGLSQASLSAICAENLDRLLAHGG
jgi:predicted TIM-barrel fold metal-dependent hydrolase